MEDKKYIVKFVYKLKNQIKFINFDTDGCSDYLHIYQEEDYWFLDDPYGGRKEGDNALAKFEFTQKELEELGILNNPIFEIQEAYNE